MKKVFLTLMLLGLMTGSSFAADDVVTAVRPVARIAKNVTVHLAHDAFNIGKFAVTGVVRGVSHAGRDAKRVVKK